MDFLAHADPGYAVTRAILGALVQSSVVISLGALLAGAAFRRRADARHALWLGVLVWVLFSPIAAAVADRSGRALWLVPLPIAGSSGTAGVDETIDAVTTADPGPVRMRSQIQIAAGAEAIGDSADKAYRRW